MLCHLTRWFISRSEDEGTARPRFAERHASRCGACREYARFVSSLSARMGAETPSFLAQAPEASPSLEGIDARGLRSRRRASGRRPVFLRPLPLASAAVTLVALLFIFAPAVFRTPGLSPADRQAAFAVLKTVTAAPDELGGAVAGAESSLDREREILEKSVISALDYVQTRLNVRVVWKERPKSL
jgi:hypothetical protein